MLTETERAAIHAFLDWLNVPPQDRNYALCEEAAGYEHNYWERSDKSPDDWLALYADSPGIAGHSADPDIGNPSTVASGDHSESWFSRGIEDIHISGHPDIRAAEDD